MSVIRKKMRGDELICPEGKSMLDVCLPSPLIAFSASKRASLRKSKSRPTSTNVLKFAAANKKAPQVLPRRGSEDYIKGLNIGLNFTREVVTESAPSALRFDEIKRKEIFSAPQHIISQRKGPSNKGIQGRHNAIGDPTSHQPCSFSVHVDKADLRQLKAFPVKPYLKKMVHEEESIEAHTSVAASNIQWDEYILNKLSHDTKDFIVNKHSHGTQRERLQQKVLSDAKEDIDSVGFKENQFMEVEPILVERNHGIEQTCSKASLASYGLSESDKETVVSKNAKDDKSSELEEEHIPAYLGKPLQRNYMEKFMTKAQRKRETILDPEQDKYVTSNYNRHAILQDVHPFTEDILQGKFSIHHPGNRSRIVFDTHTQYKRDLISCFPQEPSTWGPKQPSKRNIPMKGNRPWKNFPHLIITSYQKQVLADVTDGESCNTPGPAPSESFLDKDELSNDLLINALSQWRTTWYLDNKWRDSTLECITQDMQDISEHVRITAAIACGAALGYRTDWDLTEIIEGSGEAKGGKGQDSNAPIGGYRAYSPSEPAITSSKSMGHLVVDNLQKLLLDTSARVQVAAAVTLLAIGASGDRAKQVLLKALEKTDAMVADTWAAVQCLAMENVTERIVVNKLISMSQSLDTLIRVTATKLLVRLSQRSDVILFMVADKLNNKLWINRYMACKVIQKIRTPLNKDILHKLLTLMWSDYSENIKSVAGETIGVKGYGHVLHEELCCRLRKGNEAEKVDALKRVIHLKMMTGRMKSVFLKCFTDDHVSVRLTSAKGAGQLKFSDNDVIEGLLNLISDDHSHKVKAASIEALADIGVVNEKIISQLIWSAQYQQEGFVRGSACLVLAMLKVDSDEAVNVLRDRLTADADLVVKRASSQALEMLGLKPEKDASLIIAIKDAVKKLGSKEAILASIVHADSSSTSLLDAFSDNSFMGGSLLKSRGGSKATLTQESETPNRATDSKSQVDEAHEWPETSRVLEREKEIQRKKNMIQAVLCAQEKQVPTVKYLWRKESPTKV